MVQCTLDRQLAANEVQFPIIKYILVIIRFNLVPNPSYNITMVASKKVLRDHAPEPFCRVKIIPTIKWPNIDALVNITL